MLKVKVIQAIPSPLQINMECGAGELHALVGPSGSGKTTALRTIAGLNHAESGKIECDGQLWFEANEVNGITTVLEPAERSCGFLFQQYALFPHLTALENVSIPLYNSVKNITVRKMHAQQWLDRMGIGELANRMPNQLSGGQQQRIAIARAVIANPRLLLADEPTGNLDDEIGMKLMGLFEQLNKMGTTILIATHSTHILERLPHPRLILNQGHLSVFDPRTAPLSTTAQHGEAAHA